MPPRCDAIPSLDSKSCPLYRTLYLITPHIPANLCLKGEGAANLVGSLVELLGIERCSNAESDTWAEEDVVCNSGNTTVVELGLNRS